VDPFKKVPDVTDKTSSLNHDNYDHAEGTLDNSTIIIMLQQEI
jgi:hypothetical protein